MLRMVTQHIQYNVGKVFVHELVKDLNNIDWDIHDSSSVAVAWNSFVNKFTTMCNKHAPVKSIRFRQKSCPWLEHRDDIFNAMQLGYSMYTDEQNHHWNEYKVLSSKVNIMMKEAKKDYYTNKN